MKVIGGGSKNVTMSTLQSKINVFYFKWDFAFACVYKVHPLIISSFPQGKWQKKNNLKNSIYLVLPQLPSISSSEPDWPITAFFHSNYIILDFLSNL